MQGKNGSAVRSAVFEEVGGGDGKGVLSNVDEA